MTSPLRQRIREFAGPQLYAQINARHSNAQQLYVERCVRSPILRVVGWRIRYWVGKQARDG